MYEKNFNFLFKSMFFKKKRKLETHLQKFPQKNKSPLLIRLSTTPFIILKKTDPQPSNLKTGGTKNEA